MTTIAIDEQTKGRLEQIARSRGVALSDYLKQIAESDPLPHISAEAQQQELRRRAMSLLQMAGEVVPKPNRPAGLAGEFADAMYQKYRE